MRPAKPATPVDAASLSIRRKLVWVSLLYLAQGFPFGVVYDLLPVYFRTAGVSLSEIGLLSLLGLPWTFKVFWSPLVDRFGRRRDWTLACLAGMAAILFVLPLFPADSIGPALRAALLAFTILSATQDIAIDAYTIGLMSRGQEGPANSVRVTAFRVALILGGGALVALATFLPWSALIPAGGVLLLLLAAALWRLPAVSGGGELRSLRDSVVDPLRSFLRRPGALLVFAFVLIYKLGDAAMGPMVKPFWIDRGLTPAEIGLISTTVGMLATIAGAALGGLWVARIGIFRGLWLLGLLQAFSNLGYASVAALDLSRGFVYGASVVESFTGGLGTAAFLSFLMNVCEREHAAVQYALLSALFGLSRSVAGALSGLGAENLGYAAYFGVTFLLAFPAYALLPWVRGWVSERGDPTAAGRE